ncbi:type III-A CRISPR-associated RAMP protein Csm5, partial [Desulfamplus magnetovallimortis]|uniref:type III-A CRISPR-associated RAMP protein Csm5 n=1 Tax=Desulfamplus magnetovallimortis TaxID=1246637 RepID=UPI0009BBA18A
MKEVFKCTIKIMSPVHVGCDEVYEPTSFVVDENERQLIHFDPPVFIAGLEPDDREKFSLICRKGTINSILEIYKFFRGKSAEGRRVDLCSGFLDHYKTTLSIPEGNARRIQQELNNFSIQRTAFRVSDNRPYLPGSSIKGSLRTGCLNAKCNGAKIPLPPKNQSGHGGYNVTKKNFNEYVEKKLLNYRQIEEDPFGKVKVSDFQPVGDVKTSIIYAVNQKKKISDKTAGGPYQIFEVIEPGSLFQGEIEVVDSVFRNPLNGRTTSYINDPLNLKSLLSGAFEFYRKEHQRENRELAGVRIPTLNMAGQTSAASDLSPESGQNSSNLKESNISPLRIGRHSGAECVTIEGNRDIKIMLGKKEKKFLDHATTLWLASDKPRTASLNSLKPFGWIAVEALTPEKKEAFDSREKEYAERINREATEKAEAVKRHIEEEKKIIKEAQEKEAESQRKQEEEENLKKTLESLGTEERFIFEYDMGNIQEDQVNFIFKRIDEMDEKFKKEIASRIASYWQKNNMWTKSQAGRQWKKVRE